MARMVSVGDTGAASPLLSGVRFRACHADRAVLFLLCFASCVHTSRRVMSRCLVLSRLISQAGSRPPSVPAQSQGDVADPASFPARSGSLLVSPPHVTHARYDGYRESPCLLDRRLMDFGGFGLHTYAVPIPLAFRIAIYSLSCFASQSRLMIVS